MFKFRIKNILVKINGFILTTKDYLNAYSANVENMASS